MIINKIQEIFRSKVYARAEELPYVFLFSHTDFEGLNQKSFNVKSSLGHTLVGHFYYYDNPKQNRLIVFDHGMFGGHKSYMREIEMLARHGYLVYAYDHTGCMASGGKDTNGFGQSLRDLDDVISELKKQTELDGYEINVVGHSWGAFSTLNIVRFHPDITKIVPISGFAAPRLLINQYFKGILRIFASPIYKLEVENNPVYMECSAIDTLKNSDVKALIFHSPNDHMVSYKKHFLKMKKALKDKSGIEFVTVEGGKHNPNYTPKALEEKYKFQSEMQRLLKEGRLTTDEEHKAFKERFDWYQITEQNMEIWDKIYKFLDN